MKATELKIGDWVEYDARTGVITSLTEKVCIISIDKKYLKCPVLDKVRPVPLIKEILEKNDCMKSPNSFVLERGDYVFDIKQNENSVWAVYLIHDTGFVFINKIKSVHELQHILWAFGIDDNMKV